MARKSKTGRPRPWAVGSVRVRAIRGPRRGGEWYWRAEIHAERRTVWTGWATEADAQLVVAGLVAEGLPDPGDLDPAIVTIGQLLQAWVAHLEDERPDLTPGSLASYRSAARRVRSVARDHLIARFGAREVDGVRAQLLRRGAARTARFDLGRLRQAWEWGRSRGLAPDRQLAIPEVRIPDVIRRTPSPGEVAATLRHVTIPWRHLGIRLLYSTGARLGEVASLTREQLDAERGVIELRGKTGPRRVPIRAEMVRELTAWLATHDRPWILGVTVASARNGLGTELARASRAAGVPHISPHGLRRAAVDQLARSGVDIKTAAQLLGHTPEVMLRHYRQVTEDDLRGAIERAQLGALPEGRVIALVASGQTHRTSRTDPGDPDET